MKPSFHVPRTARILVLGVLFILSTAPTSLAQQAEIDALASRVAQEIAKTGKKKVAVVDFVAVNGKSVPLGTWLADQFSAALAKADPNLEIIDRARLRAAVQEPPLFPADSPTLDAKVARNVCQSLGTEILLSGTLGPAEKAVGITLSSFSCSASDKFPGSKTKAKISLNPEMQVLVQEPLESLLLPGGLWKGGEGGAGEPACIHCPSPRFPKEPFGKGEIRVALIQITVTADGRAADMKLIKSAGKGFDENAIAAVQKWKFKPAPGPDGNPVAVRTFVETTFRRF